jgi:hypothetical protein
VALGEARLDPRLLQRAGEERLLQRDAGQAHVTGRLQVDPVERGGQVVGDRSAPGLAERLGPRHGELARVAYGLDGAADLLGHRQPEAAGHLDDEGLHPGVGARAAQPVQNVPQVGAAHRHEGRHRVGRGGLDDPVGEIELQDQRRGAPVTGLLDDVDDCAGIHHDPSLCLQWAGSSAGASSVGAS